MTDLIENISSRIQVSDELKTAILGYFKREKVEKNTVLLRENAFCRRIYFLEEGTVRTYYHHDQKEISSWFYQEGMFFSSWYSFYQQQPSYEYIETLEDCVIHSIDYLNFQKLLNESHDFERFGRILAEEQTAFVDLYSKGYMFYSAKERYQLLLDYFPNVELKVKLGHIASFLGISQETLSRIRAGK